MKSSPHGGRRQAITGVFLAALLLAAGAIPGTVVSIANAADSSSDIPGIPLPGPVAAGRLGGAIYDVVYRLIVPAGHVIVASLTGAAGTDFDLYLFDASATTVQSTAGLLTKSIGSTSTESISWPSRLGGTYYIDLNGATDVEGDYRLTVQAVPDSTPPTASIAIAGGRPATNQLTVPVTLTASDDLSGVIEMALSEDGTTFGEWQPFAHTTSWTFQPGDGPRTLWAKVKNGVGLDSTPASAQVVIDTVSPSVVAVDPAPGASVAGLRPRFSVTFNEAMDPASWIDLGLIVQSATGALIDGAYAYDATTRVGSFVPAASLQPGASYVVTVGNVWDLAGNVVTPPGSWSVRPLVATELVASAAPKVLLRGTSARIQLTLTGAPLPAGLQVSSSTASSGFVPFTALVANDGGATLEVAPTQNTTYRFRYSGASDIAPAQVDVPVLVRRSVVLVGRDSHVTSTGRVGAPVKLTAAIGPASSGVSVSFRIYRFDTSRRTWVYAGSRGRSTDSAGRASYSWIPLSAGSFYWRAVVASTAAYANNSSPTYRWSISR